jgi:hypothetical protein
VRQHYRAAYARYESPPPPAPAGSGERSRRACVPGSSRNRRGGRVVASCATGLRACGRWGSCSGQRWVVHGCTSQELQCAMMQGRGYLAEDDAGQEAIRNGVAANRAAAAKGSADVKHAMEGLGVDSPSDAPPGLLGRTCKCCYRSPATTQLRTGRSGNHTHLQQNTIIWSAVGLY